MWMGWKGSYRFPFSHHNSACIGALFFASTICIYMREIRCTLCLDFYLSSARATMHEFHCQSGADKTVVVTEEDKS